MPPRSTKPIVNCHTHIFTDRHVPPFLARTYIFWPVYLLLHTGTITWMIKTWYSVFDRLRFTDRNKQFQKIRLAVNFFFYRLGFLYQLVGWLLTIQAFFLMYNFLVKSIGEKARIGWIERARDYLESYGLLFINRSFWWDIAIILFILVFFKWGRNAIFFVLMRVYKLLAMLPGKNTVSLLGRYLNIGRYATYKHQRDVFEKLEQQYPKGTAFIALPMDMEFMGAGNVRQDYHEQMKQLAEIKDNNRDTFFPFVFVDPRRCVKEEKGFFDFDIDAMGRTVLKDCTIKQYIEDKNFSGFKIYPALGYFPFDEALLPVWKYAAENHLPITTHCIRGTIFYRGMKKKDWNKHLVLKQTFGGGTEALLLPKIENEDFSLAFTHPLNYLCLLHEPLLREVVAKYSNETQKLFGFTDKQTPLKHNLSKLKICLAHFGGEDQWEKFLERDRDNFRAELVRYPEHGIEFFISRQTQKVLEGKIEQTWKFTDWFTIICSLMLQYENVYSDISYIVHKDDIKPLLRSILQPVNPKLRNRVLFGTDFYVVRNHKSDSNIFIDTQAGLTDEEFDLIARENPREFLYNTLHGAAPDQATDLPAGYFKTV